MNHSDDDEGHLETQARICPNCGDDHPERPCRPSELQAALDHERKERRRLRSNYENQLMLWRVSEERFITCREDDVMRAHDAAIKKAEALQKQVAKLTEELADRNKSCELWVRSSVARDRYTHHLERRMKDLGFLISRYQVGTVQALTATDEELVKLGVIDFTQPISQEMIRDRFQSHSLSVP